MHDPERFIALLNKYAGGEISPEEHSELFSYILTGEYEDLLSEHVQDQLGNSTLAGADLPPQRAQEIVHRILSAEGNTSHLLSGVPAKHSGQGVRRWMGRRRWLVAAVFIGALTLGSWFFIHRHQNPPSELAVASPLAPGHNSEQLNATGQPMKLQLEDGSVITLQPGSHLSYPLHFEKDKREVTLEGEAFFEVGRNPQRPFYVYSGNFVTHVLGTSFNVKISRQTRQIEVSVRSGKVEVYELTSRTGTGNDKFSNGLILTPNQKVVYRMDDRQFQPSLVDAPLPVLPDTARDDQAAGDRPATAFVFNAAPLSRILQTLKTAYEVDIDVENDNINNCLFTGDISTQNLYEKLDILCQALKVTYEVKATRILIRGKGCN
jgi:transmembrane sensor